MAVPAGTKPVFTPADAPSGAGTPWSPQHPIPAPGQWFPWLAAARDRRFAARLAELFLGAVLARGRRTGTSWIRVAMLSDQFRPGDTAVAAAGKRGDRIARRLLTEVVRRCWRGPRG